MHDVKAAVVGETFLFTEQFFLGKASSTELHGHVTNAMQQLRMFFYECVVFYDEGC